MLARLPEQLCFWPRREGTKRAHHVVIVPESETTMAFSGIRLPNSQPTTCGFMGLSLRVPCSSIRSSHAFLLRLAFLRKLSSCCLRHGNSDCRHTRESPTRPTSAG